MHYRGRSLIYDPGFEQDCERVFGSAMAADVAMASFLFELAHGLVDGISVLPSVIVYTLFLHQWCIVVVETVDGLLVLRTLVVADATVQLAA